MGANSQRARCPTQSANARPTTASCHCTPASRKASRQPARSARKKHGRTSGRGAERDGTVAENGKRRQITKREAVIAQLVNKSALADEGATNMLIDVLRDIEKRAEPAPAEKSSFSPTNKEVVKQLIARLRRNMCNGVPGHCDGSAGDQGTVVVGCQRDRLAPQELWLQNRQPTAQGRASDSAALRRDRRRRSSGITRLPIGERRNGICVRSITSLTSPSARDRAAPLRRSTNRSWLILYSGENGIRDCPGTGSVGRFAGAEG
jgi:hypothetical protein